MPVFFLIDYLKLLNSVSSLNMNFQNYVKHIWLENANIPQNYDVGN